VSNTLQPTDSAASAPLMLSVSGARGIFGKSMTPDVAARFAAAFGSHLVESADDRAVPIVCVARDGRPSGEAMVAAATAGLLATGCRVVDLGIATTPTVGVMIRHLGASGGIVATASHNPIIWNGLKCLDGSGAAPPAAIAATIVDRFRTRPPRWCEAECAPGATRDDSGARIHVDRVLSVVDAEAIRKRGFVVVLDSVNASGGPAGRMLLEALGCTVHHINETPHGRFAHTPEPLEENLGELCDAVRETSAAVVGFAQDPDADRLALVDGDGRFIGEEFTLVVAAKRLLDLRGAMAIAANMSTSRMIDDVVALHPGASVIRTAVGEANVVAAMREASAPLGGEGNGGVVLAEVGWIRDSLVAMALTLDLLAADDRSLARIVDAMPRYRMLKQKIDLAELGGVDFLGSAFDRLRERFDDRPIDDRDGLRIDFDDGWVHLRASNTEPIVRLIAEGTSDGRAWELIDEVAVAAGLR